MTLRDKQKQQQVDSTGTDQGHHHTTSPVLFLVASNHLRQSPRGPTLADPNDKPPTYDQIVKLDGLPPDYYTVLTTEKPPRYEDVGGRGGLGWGACASAMDLYSPDLACIHTTQPSLFLHQHQHTDNTTTTTKTTTQPSVTHHHNTTTTQPSVTHQHNTTTAQPTPTQQQQQHINTTTTHPSIFFQEPATSWSELGNHQHHQHQGYSAAAHNPAFASDDPTVLPFVLEIKDSAASLPSPTSPAITTTTTAAAAAAAAAAVSSPPAFQETT
ncbi:hypothetical protein Pcinc_038490 [Petrolisthes cinctipes]|uniref:Uncharacterized protein n=1 Tax=Petrolisthes cinctipes TaxID=88211 RepID=A0AAE1EMZ0_PETCI|nr:hypothetical protein Pcinc_038490 [Petrolisthes cinctipes]